MVSVSTGNWISLFSSELRVTTRVSPAAGLMHVSAEEVEIAVPSSPVKFLQNFYRTPTQIHQMLHRQLFILFDREDITFT